MSTLRWMAMPTLMLPLILGACTTTRVSSELDPRLEPEAYSVIMVAVAVPNLHERQILEYSFVDAVAERGFEVLGVSELFFGQRDYSQEERDEIYRDNCIEAVLLITDLASSYAAQVPPEAALAHGERCGTRRITYPEWECPCDPPPPPDPWSGEECSDPSPWVVYVGEVHDLVTGEVVWYAEADARSPVVADWTKLAKSAARGLAKQFVQDRLIAGRPAPRGFHALNTVN